MRVNTIWLSPIHSSHWRLTTHHGNTHSRGYITGSLLATNTLVKQKQQQLITQYRLASINY
jgi:hypothetical protein